jgi:hypothetical protein
MSTKKSLETDKCRCKRSFHKLVDREKNGVVTADLCPGPAGSIQASLFLIFLC